MEINNQQAFETELDKKVEITILLRRVQQIEKTRKRFFSLKAFGIVVLIGALIGGIFMLNITKYNYYWERGDEIEYYFMKSGIPDVVTNYYKVKSENTAPYLNVK